VSLDGFDWSRPGPFGTMPNIIFDDDMFMDFTDTLFSSLASNQPFAFPNPREIGEYKNNKQGIFLFLVYLIVSFF
jgi:hypothetical protein